MHARRLKTKLRCALAFTLLTYAAGARAQSSPDDPCLTDEKCTGLYEAALNLSKAGQFNSALSNYFAAYERKPVPWLLINIGRVQQKMGKPKDAIASYQKFLDQANESIDPELVVTARQYRKQAEQDLLHPKQPKILVMKEERAPRPAWRLVLGGLLLAGGAGMIGPGAYNLALNGNCVTEPVAPALRCPTVYDGITYGAPLVAVGILSLVGGVITITIPGKLVQRSVLSASPTPTVTPSPAPTVAPNPAPTVAPSPKPSIGLSPEPSPDPGPEPPPGPSTGQSSAR